MAEQNKNKEGGLEYSGKDQKTAKKVDLITLPSSIEGTNCSNCKFVKITDKEKGLGFCEHKDVQLPVTARMCCALWDHSDVKRSWEKEASMLVELIKLAYTLDKKKEYEIAREIDAVVAELAQRTGLTEKDMVSLADYFDGDGEVELANKMDELLKVAAKTKYKTHKGKDEKPPKGAEHQAPKAWWDEQADKVKKKNPGYSTKRVSEIVGDIWDNQLSDAKRQEIYRRHGKTKSPNK